MSTGVTCGGVTEYGVSGKDCTGIAAPETGVCEGCAGEAKSAGKTIQRYTGLAMWERNSHPRGLERGS